MPETTQRRLLDQDPQQRRPDGRPARAEGAGAMASGLHRLVDDDGAGGLPDLRRLPAHRRLHRPQGLGQVRLREDAGVPLGHPAGAAPGGPPGQLRHPQGREGLAGGARRVPRHAAPADRHPGRHGARQRRAAAPPRQDRALALRHAQPVPGQRRGRPPPLGDGLPAAEIFRQGRPRGGRRAAAAPLGRCRQAAHARRLQRADARLALLLHVHLLHRPRRQDAAGKPGAVGLRSALAHLPLHADRGGAPHVRRRDGRRAASSSAPARP